MKEAWWFGLPLHLLWGYVAMAIFMTGDGFEMAFLSRHIIALGFTATESSLVFTCYGLAAALAAWSSGVVAEQVTPQRAMLVGLLLWLVMHVLFMLFGLGQRNYMLMLLFYSIRGLAYPLFIYAFLMLLVQVLPAGRLAAASGWFWTMYSIGVGVAGSFLPSLLIPCIGETGTLWLALVWVAAGGLIALCSLRHVTVARPHDGLSTREKMTELSRAVTLLFANRHLAGACLLRIINQVSMYGFAVIMPLLFVDRIGFTLPQWLQIWGLIFFVTIPANVFWGLVSEKVGWLRQVRWYGCLGMIIATLAFYYLPLWAGPRMGWAVLVAVLFGVSLAAFVPLTAVFPALEPQHKGAALSIYNLSAGLSNFAGPAIATLVMPHFAIVGVVWVYAGLYLLGMLLTVVIKVPQPGHN